MTALPTLLLALGCGDAPIPATTVQGVQVVALQAFPPNPEPDEVVTVKVWVADALGLGADVLVWMCTPILGTCVEAWLPGTQGMPLDLWTATGETGRTFEITRPWPYFRELTVGAALQEASGGSGSSTFATDLPVEIPEDEDPALFVWALACVPGRCPAIDAVKADPVAGSDAWREVVAGLADPSRMLEGVPAHQASVAVKEIPLWEPLDPFATTFDPDEPLTPDQAPILTWVHPVEVPPPPGATTFATPGLPGSPRASTLDELPIDAIGWFDADGEAVEFQAFTTAGAVQVSTRPEVPGMVFVARRRTFGGELGDVFLVGEDGRGGTAVWDGRRTADEDFAVCGEPGVRHDVGEWGRLRVGLVFDVGIELTGLAVPERVSTRILAEDGEVLAQGAVQSGNCPVASPSVPMAWTGVKGPCKHGGEVATLSTTVDTDPLLETETTVVLTLDPAAPCTE